MEAENLKDSDPGLSKPKVTNAPHVVMADTVQAEEVPTIPIGSLQTISELRPEVSVHSVEATESVSMPTPLVAQSSEYRRTFGEWLQIWRDGMRLSYLSLPLMPVILGTALAWSETVNVRAPLGRFHFLHFIGALLAIILLQIGANLVNDYYDYLRGVDTTNLLGPGGLIQQGLIRPIHVVELGLALLFIGSVFGLIIAVAGGPLVFLFGLISVLCAYFYSATRRSLSSITLGELAIFCIYGPLITLGAYALQLGYLSNTALIYGLPLGLIAAAIVHVNNMRDMEGDKHAGKRTLATLIGFRWSRALYILLLLVAYAIIIRLGLPSHAPHLILIALWTLPGLVVAVTGVLRTDTPASLHIVMHQTLRLEVFFTILLVIGLVVWTLIPVAPHIPELLPI